MKLSNYIMIFLTIGLCLALIPFVNIDITSIANERNIAYSNKLTSACYDAAQTMKTDNIEKYGCIWNDEDDLCDTLDVFYNSLVYSFNWDTMGRVDEMALYTPVVCLIDVNGYYISHNVVFDTTGMVQIPSDAEKRNGLTALNTWSKTYSGVIMRYFLNDNVEIYTLAGKKYSGNRKEVYKLLQEELPGSTEEAALAFIINDDEFSSEKNSVIIQEINKQCEYYINRHNIIGDNYEMQYTFEMPEVAGEDWSRLVENPTIISFLQGYSTQTSNNMLNIYALGGGELVSNYHYFIDSNDDYHCLEAEPGVVKTYRSETVTYEEDGVTKTKTVEHVVYEYNGMEIEVLYPNQTECAKRGALPHKCVYDWN